MEIRKHIEQKISDYLIKLLNDLINNKDYNIDNLSDRNFGEYKIIVLTEYIQVYSNNTTFYFYFLNKKLVDKTFFGFKKIFFFKLGFYDIIENSIYGELKDKINFFKQQEDLLGKNKDMIDSLPDDIKKDIIRLQKLKSIIE